MSRGSPPTHIIQVRKRDCITNIHIHYVLRYVPIKAKPLGHGLLLPLLSSSGHGPPPAVLLSFLPPSLSAPNPFERYAALGMPVRLRSVTRGCPALGREDVSSTIGRVLHGVHQLLSIRAPRPPPVTSALNLLRLTSQMHGPTERAAPIPRRDRRRHPLKPIKDNTISRYTPDVFPQRDDYYHSL